MTRRIPALALAAAVAFAVPAAAQNPAEAARPATRVLQGDQVTERNLVDALAPRDVDPGAMRTRGLRPQPAAAPAGGQAADAGTGSASLLITFLTNSSTLTTRAREQLDVLGKALNNDKLAGLGFTIEGHADPRGSAQLNLALSQSRAESVRTYLIEQHQVAAERLSAVGKGDAELLNRDNPIAPENRRVTIVTRPE